MIIKQAVEIINKKEYYNNTYKCDWCGHIFKQSVRSSINVKGNKIVSSQVKCKNCQNFIKTWK